MEGPQPDAFMLKLVILRKYNMIYIYKYIYKYQKKCFFVFFL